MNAELQLSRSLTFRYVMALTLVALLSTGAWLSLQLVISAQERTAEVVNISGRQRMLSQRTALLARQYLDAVPAERPRLISELTEHIAQMRKAHRWLTEGDSVYGQPIRLSAELHALYYGPEHATDQQLQRYLSALEAVPQLASEPERARAQIQQIIDAGAPLLASLDAVVLQYQREGEAAITALKRTEVAVWLLTLLLLVLEGQFIFRPFRDQMMALISRLQGTLGQLEDNRRRLEAEVRNREAVAEALGAVSAEQRAILDTASSGIVLLRDRVVIQCNRRLHEILGWPDGSLVGHNTRDWYPDEASYQIIGDAAYPEINAGHTHRRDQLMQRHDGSLVWTRVVGHAVDAGDPSRGSVWVIDDITAERESAEEMRRARLLAEDAAKTKSEFLANMSHEIRTPMNAIIGMTRLTLGTSLDRQQRDYLSKIQSASQHLLAIINDILDFSKIEAGKMTLEKVSFDLENVLDNVVTLIAERCAAKGLELLVEVDPQVPARLLGDPLRLGQVLANFASNAVKFTHQGEVVIRVERLEHQGDHVTLRLLVSDTGIGIDEAQRERLFQSFQQADASITRRFGGTGLGLAISRRLVDLMGGTIGIDSTPGKGSTFWFSVNLKAEGEAAYFDRLRDMRSARVLVVDDHEHARRNIGEMLVSMRFAAGTAADAHEALGQLSRADQESVPYDVVLLDAYIPGETVADTVERIQALTLRARPALILLDGYERADAAEGALPAGIVATLTKPPTPSSLLDTLMTALLPVGYEAGAAHGAYQTLHRDLASLAGARVLLVEDNELNQEVALALLHALELKVELAEDGAIALDKVRSNTYDLILMDMQMPVMDGLTATRAIRQMPGLAELPILALTANAMAGDRERCLAAGMNDHLPKPIDPDDLFAKLSKWLGARLPAQAARAVPTPAASGSPFASIDGLDTAQGLRYANGNPDLYRDLLTRFARSQRTAIADIERALSEERLADAERLAHTLKGVAAQIGAQALSNRAGQLEETIRHRQPPAERALGLTALQTLLTPLLDTLTEVLAPAEPISAPAADIQEWPLIKAGLIARLEAFDIDSIPFAQGYEPELRARLGEDYAVLEQALQAYDFDQALACLSQAEKV